MRRLLVMVWAVAAAAPLRRAAAIAFASAIGLAFQPQTLRPGETSPLRFEVASVRLADRPSAGADCGGGPGTGVPNRFRCNAASLLGLIRLAYNLPFDQISAPNWFEDTAYTISAPVPEGISTERFRAMIQNLLADRFGLVLHREQRELPAFELKTAKDGPKLKDAADPDAAPLRPDFRFSTDRDGFPEIPQGSRGIAGAQSGGVSHLTARSASIADLVARLAAPLGVLTGQSTYAPGRITDVTGLSGRYDFTLAFAGNLGAGGAFPRQSQTAGEATLPGAPVPLAAPLLADALEQQLGLRLVSTKARVEVLVIDRAQRIPTEN